MSDGAAVAVSVVIPTHNRWAQLRRVLDGFAGQCASAPPFEVLVCDDASDDETPRAVHDYAAGAPFALSYLHQEKRGPAAARNLGAGVARAPVLLFTDDDCVPDAALVARHRASTGPRVATIGRIEWHPEIEVTPLMAFLSPGYRFNFAQIADPRDATYRCFYTANVSVWRDDFRAVGGFDEQFPAAAYEDIELGYRLHRSGVRLAYDRDAVVYHLHSMELLRMVQSQLVNGESTAYAFRKHPELLAEHGEPSLGLPLVRSRFYRAVLDYAFALGMKRGLESRDGADWPARIADVLAQVPVYRSRLEEQFCAAEEYAQQLELRLAEQQAAYEALAASHRRLEGALRAANPLKNRLRRWLRE